MSKWMFASGFKKWTSHNKSTVKSSAIKLSWSWNRETIQPNEVYLYFKFRFSSSLSYSSQYWLWVVVEYCRLLFILFSGKMWHLRSCLEWLIFWIPMSQWMWNAREGESKISKGRWKKTCVLTAQYRNWAWFKSFARRRRRLNWSWSQIVRMLFENKMLRYYFTNLSSDSPFRKSSTVGVENNFEQRKCFRNLIRRIALRFGVFVEVDGSSFLLCRAHIDVVSQNVESNDLRGSKYFDFLATS